MRKLENLGFALMAMGFCVFLVTIIFVPIQKSPEPIVKVKKVALVKVAPLSTREQVLVAAYRNGWTGVQWDCLVKIINIENPGWLIHRRNSESTASGLFQVLRSPSGRMFSSYSVADQSRLGTRYIAARYKNPCRALKFHLQHGYF